MPASVLGGKTSNEKLIRDCTSEAIFMARDLLVIGDVVAAADCSSAFRRT